MATFKLIKEQSKKIARFWIDDVYLTGFLLYGLEGIQWFAYQDNLKWSYYFIRDVINSTDEYPVYYNYIKNATEFYKFVGTFVLQVKNDQIEINYNRFTDHSLFLNLINKTSKNVFIKNNYFKYDFRDDKNYTCSNYVINTKSPSLSLKNEVAHPEKSISICFYFKINLYNMHFYDIYRSIYLENIYIK